MSDRIMGIIKKRFINDSEEPIPIISEYPIIKTCEACNKNIKFGSAVYEGLCWDCFRRKVITIAKEAKTLEDTEIILHLLDITKSKTGIVYMRSDSND